MSYLAAFFFFLFFTLFKFDVFSFDISRIFLGTLTKDYINIQWFLAWDIKHFLQGFSGYWSPPFYTPLPMTLGFGDHVLGQSLLMIAPYMATQNTVLCYNLLFLTTFVLTGLAAYCLFFHLTRHAAASVIMSAAFNYCHFRYSILQHVYVLSIYPMIFFLVFAHKYVVSRRGVTLALAYACLLWQVFSGMNMGLFCFYIGFFFFVFYWWMDPTLRTKRTALGVIAGHSTVALAFAFLAIPNVLALRAQEIAWRWGDVVRHSSHWGNFLSTAPTNLLTQPWMDRFFSEVVTVRNFPGVFTAVVFVLAWRRWWPDAARVASPVWRSRLSAVLLIAAAAMAVYGVAVFLVPALQSMDIERKIEWSGWSVLLLLTAVIVNKKWSSAFRAAFQRMPLDARFYALLSVSTFLFSFALFYKALYTLAPGFSGVRVPARLLEFFQLGLCALGGYGLTELLRRSRETWKRTAAAVGLLAVFAVESVNSGIPKEAAPPLPAAHEWLSRQNNVTGILEFPFPSSVADYEKSTDYVYWTTFHWLPSVHGYSSFFPRYYYWLMPCLNDAGVSADYLRALNVNHVVCHWNKMNAAEAARLKTALEREKIVAVFASEASSVYFVAGAPPPNALAVSPLPEGTRLNASIHADRVSNAMDANRKTAWKTGRAQREGDWIEMTLPAPRLTRGAAMRLGKNFMDYPRGVRVEGNKNGVWTVLTETRLPYPSASDFRVIVETASDPVITLTWSAETCSALRFTLTESTPAHHWTIAELELL